MRDIETLNIESLHPKLKSVAHKLVAECEKHGLPIGIVASIRDGLMLRQKELGENTFAEGIMIFRKDNGYPWSAEGGFFDKVGKIGKSLGLEWGGDFKFKSPAYFRLPKDGGGNA